MPFSRKWTESGKNLSPRQEIKKWGVEKLKDRKYEEFEYEYNREQAKENDDMNQKLYHRKIM